MTWQVTADVLRFDEAVDFFLGRVVMTAAQVVALDADIQERAFWIGASLQLDQIQSVHDKITKAIESGEPFDDWRKRVRDTLTDDAHAETVFRNAAQKSYNAGRYRQMSDPDVLKFRPYWMFDAVLDSRTTQTICKPRDGVVLPAEHEFWQTATPPLHHRCRSSLRSLRESEAKRRGISKQAPDVDVPEGWGKAPTDDPIWKPDAAKLDKALNSELKRKAKKKPAPVPTLTTLVGK